MMVGSNASPHYGASPPHRYEGEKKRKRGREREEKKRIVGKEREEKKREGEKKR
jgi:hypothetical protein